MTPQRCIAMNKGRRYAGVFFDTCYGSENLDATTFVPGDTCSIPCPGDANQICGGNAVAGNVTTIRVRRKLRPRVAKRAAPPNVLLTIYELIVGLPGTTIVGPGATVLGIPPTVVEPGTTVSGPVVPGPASTVAIGAPTTVTAVSPGAAGSGPGADDEFIVNPVPPAETSLVESLSTASTVHVTQNPNLPGSAVPINPPVLDIIRSVVTTVTYTIVDPTEPTGLLSVELCTTLYFEDCNCPTQVIPAVPMATVESKCRKCGPNGENTVTLTVPADLNRVSSSGSDVSAGVPEPPKVSPGHGGGSDAVADSASAPDGQDTKDVPNVSGSQQVQNVPATGPDSPPSLATPVGNRPINPGPAGVPAPTPLGNIPGSTPPGSDALAPPSSPNTVVVAGAQGLRHSLGLAYLAPAIACSLAMLSVFGSY
ncbi:hypothetical protein CCHL11_07387 [Colletotrichum chlorophyti]|uniref:WSC domain-containing protein n=1 Tax=Colletotrichum chlorophyti TaxID=708187 RepID=A0A1Q8S695_9PEZI|nr:hypothetical protein CCHL11_07387 [Colletotrichum chlorophyti]